jgi:hypothetical protein
MPLETKLLGGYWRVAYAEGIPPEDFHPRRHRWLMVPTPDRADAGYDVMVVPWPADPTEADALASTIVAGGYNDPGSPIYKGDQYGALSKGALIGPYRYVVAAMASKEGWPLNLKLERRWMNADPDAVRINRVHAEPPSADTEVLPALTMRGTVLVYKVDDHGQVVDLADKDIGALAQLWAAARGGRRMLYIPASGPAYPLWLPDGYAYERLVGGKSVDHSAFSKHFHYIVSEYSLYDMPLNVSMHRGEYPVPIHGACLVYKVDDEGVSVDLDEDDQRIIMDMWTVARTGGYPDTLALEPVEGSFGLGGLWIAHDGGALWFAP